jgi:hypothetical protein
MADPPNLLVRFQRFLGRLLRASNVSEEQRVPVDPQRLIAAWEKMDFGPPPSPPESLTMRPVVGPPVTPGGQHRVVVIQINVAVLHPDVIGAIADQAGIDEAVLWMALRELSDEPDGPTAPAV